MSALRTAPEKGVTGRYLRGKSKRIAGVHKNIGPASAVHPTRTGTEKVVRQIIRTRAQRAKFLPGHLLSDPAWDMLLDLYLADILSKQISVTSLCSASKVPATTALRWIATLNREGLVVRRNDAHDHRRYFMSLSGKGLAAMDGFFRNAAALTMRA